MADMIATIGRPPVVVQFGENTAEAIRQRALSEASASAAALSEATAESAAGPTYADTSTGLAATTDGHSFAVDNGDGTVTIYLNDGGAAVEQRTLATTAALASSSGGEMVGKTGGGTVQDDLTKLSYAEFPQSLGRKSRGLPAAFNWFTGPFRPGGCLAPGAAFCAVDLETRFDQLFSGLQNPANKRWVSPTGNDANTGAGPQQAWRTAAKAASSGSSDVVFFYPGKYYGSTWKIDRSVSNASRKWFALGDVKIYGGEDPSLLTFTQKAGTTYVYEMVFTTGDPVENILDMQANDKFGFNKRMPMAADAASVNGSGYGWYYDAGTKTLTVRYGTKDLSANPELVDIIFGVPDVSGPNPFGTMPRMIDQALYMHGFTFMGTGFRCINTLNDGRANFYGEKCRFLHSRYKGFHSDGCETWLKDCIAYDSDQDNVSYYSAGAANGRAVEINLWSYGAGQSNKWEPGTHNKNASTIHHQVTVIRFNGDYALSDGPTIADTGTGAAYNIGCKIGRPTYQEIGAYYSDVDAWLDTCAVDAGVKTGDTGYDVYADAATIRVFNTSFALSTTANGGSIVSFTP